MVYKGAQSTKSDPTFVGTGMLTRGGQREQAHFPQIDWQGFTRRADRNPKRQWINNLEVAEDFPGAVAARYSWHCHLMVKANQGAGHRLNSNVYGHSSRGHSGAEGRLSSGACSL
jgi:hypothetical protein